MDGIRLARYLRSEGTYRVEFPDTSRLGASQLEPMGILPIERLGEGKEFIERPMDEVLKIAQERGATIVAKPRADTRMKDFYILFRERIGVSRSSRSFHLL